MSLVTQRSIFALALVALGLGWGCAREKLAREGRVSRAQADSYLRDAVRQSSEGVLLEPSQAGIDSIERVRLAEIAQELRRPAAICFLERAIATMEPGMVDGEPGWLGVPEGQAKIRARVAVDGTVLTTDLLESGFRDEEMEACLGEVIRKQRFVESRDGFAYHIDVYYWVSLGFFAEAQTKEFAEQLRREQTTAGVRAKACLTGRVAPGEYEVGGLNLFDREGRTVVNRIERGELPAEVGSCVAAAMKQIRIHAEPDAFIRPAAPEVVFTVEDDGTVSVADERWLELILLEEKAARERKKAELLGQPIGASSEAETSGPQVDRGEPPPPPAALGRSGGEVPTGLDAQSEQIPEQIPEQGGGTQGNEEGSEGEGTSDPSKPAAPADPTAPGTRLDLSPRRAD